MNSALRGWVVSDLNCRYLTKATSIQKNPKKYPDIFLDFFGIFFWIFFFGYFLDIFFHFYYMKKSGFFFGYFLGFFFWTKISKKKIQIFLCNRNGKNIQKNIKKEIQKKIQKKIWIFFRIFLDGRSLYVTCFNPSELGLYGGTDRTHWLVDPLPS